MQAEFSADAFILAITRMSGICLGVLLLEACAVIIFPKMATKEALNSMQAAMSGLVELNRKAWQQGTGRKEAAEIDLGTPMCVYTPPPPPPPPLSPHLCPSPPQSPHKCAPKGPIAA